MFKATTSHFSELTKIQWLLCIKTLPVVKVLNKHLPAKAIVMSNSISIRCHNKYTITQTTTMAFNKLAVLAGKSSNNCRHHLTQGVPSRPQKHPLLLNLHSTTEAMTLNAIIPHNRGYPFSKLIQLKIIQHPSSHQSKEATQTPLRANRRHLQIISL